MQAFNAVDEIKDADNYPMIRLFTADLKTATTPQAELLGVEQPWSVASSSEGPICCHHIVEPFKEWTHWGTRHFCPL